MLSWLDTDFSRKEMIEERTSNWVTHISTELSEDLEYN